MSGRAKWVAENLRIPSKQLAALLGYHVAYMARLKRRAPLWLCYVIRAYNEGWRPVRDWTTASDEEKRRVLTAWVRKWHGRPMGSVEYLWDFPETRSGERWCNSLALGRHVGIPARIAFLADLIVQGYEPLDGDAAFQ